MTEIARLEARCEALGRQLATAERERDTARGEAAQLREQLRVTHLVGEDEKQRAAYEAMDTERRGWESRRAVENVHLAEVKRERDAALAQAAAIDPQRVDRALRAVIAELDYDLHKAIESDEETGQDTYHETVADFIKAYEAGEGR